MGGWATQISASTHTNDIACYTILGWLAYHNAHRPHRHSKFEKLCYQTFMMGISVCSAAMHRNYCIVNNFASVDRRRDMVHFRSSPRVCHDQSKNAKRSVYGYVWGKQIGEHTRCTHRCREICVVLHLRASAHGRSEGPRMPFALIQSLNSIISE